jgi:mannose-6-phosphate isomerase
LKEDLIRGNLEPRLRHGLLPSGYHQPNLRNDWAPKLEQKATLVSQSRAIYLFAVGYEVTRDRRYLEASTRAADYLLSHFADQASDGRWVRGVMPDGQVVDRGFHAYGHAQAIFALAHVFKVSGDRKYLDAAMRTWLAMDVLRAVERNNSVYQLRELGVAMHLFESLLALYKVTGSDMVRGELRALGDYIVAHYYDPDCGCFVESLTTAYTRDRNGDVRPGHSAQMAFLLSRAVDVGLPSTYLDAANASIDFVARVAAGDPNGIIPHTTDYGGKVRDPEYYWWSQTELLRGLAHFVVHRGRDDLRGQFQKSLRYVREHYIDPVYGGWYRKPDGKTDDKGNDWKVGYHVAMMITELLRLNGEPFRTGAEILL